jgi:hypothetical protein
MFRIDPIDVLRSDREEWLIRMVSAEVVSEDERKAAEKQKASMGSRSARKVPTRRGR